MVQCLTISEVLLKEYFVRWAQNGVIITIKITIINYHKQKEIGARVTDIFENELVRRSNAKQ